MPITNKVGLGTLRPRAYPMMPTEDEWRSLIAEGAIARLPALSATEYRKHATPSFASPAMLVCEDGQEYWVKHLSANNGCFPVSRTQHLGGMVADHVLGLLAPKIVGNVVPEVRLVNVPPELIAIAPKLQQACPGLAHGSKNVGTNCTDRLNFTDCGYFNHPINRPRFASLAVFYGLCIAIDFQVIFRLDSEPTVFSVDHGHLLPGGPSWMPELFASHSDGRIDPNVVSACGITQADLVEPIGRLRTVSASDIARAVAAPPDNWFFPESDRILMAKYLWTRKEAILSTAA